MNIGYVLFAAGIIGVMAWSGSLSASTRTDPVAAPTECVQTLMGDIAMCE
jgi:hypothetical protein